MGEAKQTRETEIENAQEPAGDELPRCPECGGPVRSDGFTHITDGGSHVIEAFGICDQCRIFFEYICQVGRASWRLLWLTANRSGEPESPATDEDYRAVLNEAVENSYREVLMFWGEMAPGKYRKYER